MVGSSDGLKGLEQLARPSVWGSPAQTRLLLVEDGRTQAFKLEQSLLKAGYQVKVSPTGTDALTQVSLWNPDLVLLDVNLPDLDGREVARAIRADPVRAGIPIVFMTGVFREVQDVIQALDDGADDYLLKPIDPAELVSRVNACLRSKRTSGELLRLSRQLVLVHQVGREMAGLLEPLPLLETAVLSLQQHFGYEHVHALLVENDELKVAAGTAWGEATQPGSLALRCLREVATVHASLEGAEGGEKVFVSSQTRHGVALPLLSGSATVGVLEIATDRSLTQENSEQMVLQMLADLIAVSLSNARVHKELQNLATQDELTSCLNRRATLARLELEFGRALRYKRPLTLLCLDIDQFKSINDTYGHLVGDQVLRALAQELLKTLRNHDMLGRVGGDEFLVMLPETDEVGADGIVPRMLKACRELSFVSPQGVSLEVRISIGIATLSQAVFSNSKELIRAADEALYRAKAAGRNQVSR